MSRQVLIGPLPPPLGGISVYLYRLVRRLQDEGHTVEVVDLARLPAAARTRAALGFLLDPRPATYYLNGPSFLTMTALLLRQAPARVVFHDHNDRALEGFGPLRRAIFSRFLARADEVRLVSEEVAAYHRRHGVEPDPARTVIRHAFLPPPPGDEPGIRASYDPATRDFLAAHRPLLVANAYRIVLEGGVDLYGLDLCIDLIAALVREHPRIGLLVGLAEVGEASYFALLRRRIAEAGLEDHIHFLSGQRELWPVFREADLLVRPTAADGYPLSVAEALHLGCAVVASDVCRRPEGVRVFRSRDRDDLLRRCREALAARSPGGRGEAGG